MKTYWDLTEKERAALDREGVERYIDAELMTKGCLRAEPPKLEPVPGAPELPRERYYMLTGTRYGRAMLFRTTEDAQTVIDLCVGEQHSQHIGGDYQNSVDYADAQSEAKIESADLPSLATVTAAKALLDKRAAIEKLNRERQKTYDQALKDQDEVLGGLWDDWRRCQRMADEHERVHSTFQRYVQIADGDEATAAKFLRTAFSVADVMAAEQWFGEQFGAADEEAA